MFKNFKIISRLVLVAGLIILSFKPSNANYVSPNIIHPNHVAFSQFESISKRQPLTAHNRGLRCNFQKNDNNRRLPVVVVLVPMVNVFAFNVLQFNLVTSQVSFLTASSPAKTVVLRI